MLVRMRLARAAFCWKPSPGIGCGQRIALHGLVAAAVRTLAVTIAAARAPVAFVDPALPHERKLRSSHGSLTPDEMFVPLVAGWGCHG